MKAHVFVLLIIMFTVVPVVRSAIVWEYDSPLTIVETITEIESGTYLYEYSFENTDTSTIWDFVLYTTFNVQPVDTWDGYDVWVNPQFTTVQQLSSAYDPHILDDEIIGGIWTGYEYWTPVFGEEEGIQPNDEAAGFSYVANIFNATPKYYCYTTIETNGPGPYLQGNVSAVGQTIPEPATLVLFGWGFCVVRKLKHYNFEGEVL